MRKKRQTTKNSQKVKRDRQPPRKKGRKKISSRYSVRASKFYLNDPP